MDEQEYGRIRVMQRTMIINWRNHEPFDFGKQNLCRNFNSFLAYDRQSHVLCGMPKISDGGDMEY